MSRLVARRFCPTALSAPVAMLVVGAVAVGAVLVTVETPLSVRVPPVATSTPMPKPFMLSVTGLGIAVVIESGVAMPRFMFALSMNGFATICPG